MTGGAAPSPEPAAAPAWSLRRRLTRRVLALVAVGWLATILVSAVVLDHEMTEMFDGELQALVETTVLYLDTAQAGSIPRTLGVQTSDSERVLRILPADQPPAPAPWPALEGDGFHDLPGWRVLRRSAEGVVIEAAHATDLRREEKLEAASAFLLLALPLIGFLVWGLRRIVAEATAPVARLAGAVSGRSTDDLSPVGAEGLPRELRPLAMAFDHYLGRIEALRRSERDFIANAAHELRTPLAALRGRLELSPDPDAAAAVEAVDGLSRRVERLLQLARQEAGLGLGRGPCDLRRVLELVVADLRQGDGQPIRLDDGDLERLDVAADADAVAILLRNLIENAQQHGSGPVDLRLRADGRLSIANPATVTDLPEGRFARGAGSAGLGLGLSISEALVRSMGVRMARRAGNGRVQIDLDFPLPPDAAA